jgi:hypothetical protein
MTFNFRLMRPTIPPEDVAPPQSYADEESAIQAAQRLADETGEEVHILRTHPGKAENQPYRVIHPSK